MFYLIGLGLGGADDVTVKGLDIIKKCSRIYLEAYTSILTVGRSELERFYEREIIVADRTMVEQHSDEIFQNSKEVDVAFLVVGDPFGATTHSDLMLRAREKSIPCSVIHNASIMNAIGCTGLQLYTFGETVSIVFWTDTWKPESYYDKIVENRKRGLHTLCLLDIKMKEQTIENLMKCNEIYEPPRYMSIGQALSQLIEIVNNRKSGKTNLVFDENTKCVGVARVGSDDQKIVYGSLEELQHIDFGKPLHSLVVTGKMHDIELEMVKLHAC